MTITGLCPGENLEMRDSEQKRSTGWHSAKKLPIIKIRKFRGLFTIFHMPLVFSELQTCYRRQVRSKSEANKGQARVDTYSIA